MALDPLLEARLARVAERRRRLALWSSIAATWAACASLGLALIAFERQTGWGSVLALPVFLSLGLAGALILASRVRNRATDFRELAREIERKFPQLDGRLITAAEQHPESDSGLNFLQQRIVDEALAHDAQHHWVAIIPISRIKLAQMAHWLA